MRSAAPKKRRIRRKSLAGALATACAIALLFLSLLNAHLVYEYQDSFDGATLPQVDAIVCLAGGRGRIAAAGDLWYRYWEESQSGLGFGPAPDGRTRASEPRPAPVLYLSGVGPRTTRAGLNLQLRRGVVPVLDDAHVVLETESTNTVENAAIFSRIARERGWTHVLLMTSSYHMLRARSVFEAVLRAQNLPVHVETLSVIQEPFSPDEWSGSLQGIRVTLEEYFKMLWVRFFWKPSVPKTTAGG